METNVTTHNFSVAEFAKAQKFIAVTDDGSYGAKMNAVQAFAADLEKGNRPDVGLACGPTPMLRALIKVVEEEKLCKVSTLRFRR